MLCKNNSGPLKYFPLFCSIEALSVEGAGGTLLFWHYLAGFCETPFDDCFPQEL